MFTWGRTWFAGADTFCSALFMYINIYIPVRIRGSADDESYVSEQSIKLVIVPLFLYFKLFWLQSVAIIKWFFFANSVFFGPRFKMQHQFYSIYWLHSWTSAPQHAMTQQCISHGLTPHSWISQPINNLDGSQNFWQDSVSNKSS